MILSEQLCLEVFKRLDDLGWEAEGDDYDAVAFAADKTYEYILDFCNIASLPKELYAVYVDMAAGEFLMDMYSVNKLSGYTDGQLVKSISEGDVSITYNNSESVRELEALMERLTNKKEILYSFRRLKW